MGPQGRDFTTDVYIGSNHIKGFVIMPLYYLKLFKFGHIKEGHYGMFCIENMLCDIYNYFYRATEKIPNALTFSLTLSASYIFSLWNYVFILRFRCMNFFQINKLPSLSNLSFDKIFHILRIFFFSLVHYSWCESN